jgi:hypothetical protein
MFILFEFNLFCTPKHILEPGSQSPYTKKSRADWTSSSFSAPTKILEISQPIHRLSLFELSNVPISLKIQRHYLIENIDLSRAIQWVVVSNASFIPP